MKTEKEVKDKIKDLEKRKKSLNDEVKKKLKNEELIPENLTERINYISKQLNALKWCTGEAEYLNCEYLSDKC